MPCLNYLGCGGVEESYGMKAWGDSLPTFDDGIGFGMNLR